MGLPFELDQELGSRPPRLGLPGAQIEICQGGVQEAEAASPVFEEDHARDGGRERTQEALGICDDGTIPKTALEMAKEKGMRIGLVTNSTIYDASPAAFAGHVSNRRYFNLIIDQYLRLGVDLLLGGGRDQFLPQKQPGSTRKDDNDMIAAFIRQGYTYASDKLELSRAKGSKLFGLFSLQEMSFELDRDKDKEPSLTEMTQAAIRFLEEGNQRGFMLFIENENTDTASAA